ncbi:MAG: chorismate-binding protein, partial [Actinomycetota bacterium]
MRTATRHATWQEAMVEQTLQIHPGRDVFTSLVAERPLAPVWAELLADVSTPVGLFPAVAGKGPAILLESVERSERWGRYSFVAGDPAAVVIVDADGVEILDVARELPWAVPAPGTPPREALTAIARSLAASRVPELPALTGGLMGYLSYEAAGLLDGHPAPDPDGAPCPPIGLMVIDRAVVFDHWRQRLLLVAHAPVGGYDAAVAALEELAARLGSASLPPLAPVSEAATDHAAQGHANMEDDRYREIVATFKEHILAGDIYQGVPSRRVSFPATEGGFPIYRRLRVSNPAPYMFFVR